MTNDRHLYHWKESTGKPLIRKSLPINSILPTCSIQAGYGQIKGSHHSSIACCQIVPRRQTKQLWSIKGNHQQLLYLYMENPISMLIYIYIYISNYPLATRSDTDPAMSCSRSHCAGPRMRRAAKLAKEHSDEGAKKGMGDGCPKPNIIGFGNILGYTLIAWMMAIFLHV